MKRANEAAVLERAVAGLRADLETVVQAQQAAQAALTNNNRSTTYKFHADCSE